MFSKFLTTLDSLEGHLIGIKEHIDNINGSGLVDCTYPQLSTCLHDLKTLSLASDIKPQLQPAQEISNITSLQSPVGIIICKQLLETKTYIIQFMQKLKIK